MKPVITYRGATMADVDSIVNMEAVSLNHPWGRSDIEALMNEPSENAGKIAIIAEVDGVPVAYVGAAYILDECEIGNVCTHPDYRRLGAAYGLLEELKNKCKELDIGSIFLEVSSTNDGAISLYKKFGFEQYNLRKDYYGKGDDALLFVYRT